MAVPVPALLAEFRREKRAAPSMADTHSVGRPALVSREAAELAARELRSILGQQGTTAQDAVACGTDTSPQPLSPTVSVPSSPAPTPVPAALDLHDHSPESTSADAWTTHSHGCMRGEDGGNDITIDGVVTSSSTTATSSTSRTLGRHSSFDYDDDIGGFFSYDARRRRQMMALRTTTSESDDSSTEEEDTSDDEAESDEDSTIALTNGRHRPACRERIGKRSRATVLRGGMLAALWASKMLLRSRARKEGRRLGSRSYRPLIPQKWLETSSQEAHAAQAAEQGAYQAYLKLQLMEEKELSLSTSERILVEFPVWLLVPTALIIYMLLQVSQTFDDHREL